MNPPPRHRAPVRRRQPVPLPTRPATTAGVGTTGVAGPATVDEAHPWAEVESSPRRPAPWLTVLAAGTVAAAVAALPGSPLAGPPAAVLQLAAAAAVAVGARRGDAAHRQAWWTLSAAVACAAVGQGLWSAGPALPQLPALPVAGEALFLLLYPLLAYALFRLGCRRADGVRLAGVLDAAVLTVGVGAAAWTLVIHPLLETPDLTAVARPVGLTFAALDLVVVAAAARAFFVVDHRLPAVRLLGAAVATLLAGDTAYHVRAALTGEQAPPGFAAACWLMWTALVAAAALHPSTGRRLPYRRPGYRGRVVLFLLLSSLGPMLVVAGAAVAARLGEEYDWRDAVVPGSMGALMAVLLVLRLAELAGRDRDRLAELARQAEQLSTALREQEALQRQLSHHLLHDPLTGLPNRVLLHERLERGLARRGGARMQLLLLDLDGFRNVNDELGHAIGDELLVQASHRLLGRLEPTDTAARLGADEFAVLLEDVPAERARTVAAGLLEALRAPYRVAGREVSLTASVGLLTVRPPLTPSEALRDADLALQQARRGGRDRLAFFEPRLRSSRLDQARITSALRRAIADDEFTLAFQPVVDLATGEVRTVESLLRWAPAALGPVNPTDFIPVAEQTGLVVPLGSWVLERACAQGRRWFEQHGVTVAVNVSAHQLRDPAFPDTVRAVLRRTGMPGAGLVLEITESALVAESGAETEQAHARLAEIRALGVRIAIDDFGTGYSSLSYLRHLPIDVLKVDKAFVQGDLDRSPRERAFIRAILQLAESLRLPTVAEGVETAEQARVLRELGCPLGQGFLFHRPMSAAALDELLHTPATAPTPAPPQRAVAA